MCNRTEFLIKGAHQNLRQSIVFDEDQFESKYWGHFLQSAVSPALDGGRQSKLDDIQ